MIRRITEVRGQYEISVYEVDIDAKMKRDALKFARDIILSDNQYSRLLPENIRNSNDVTMQKKIEIQRTYMGKLGEIAFLQLLVAQGKNVNTQGMFEIYEGQKNVDEFDFVTKRGESVDVKSGFRNNHKRLLVNVGQFDSKPKKYYVGVKLNALDIDAEQKLVDWDNITLARIEGYAEYSYMRRNAGIDDFGEGNARWLLYNKLLGIDRLIQRF